MLLCVLTAACHEPGAPRHRQIVGILEERASNLTRETVEEIARGLLQAERASGVDALLLLSVVHEESHFRPKARSRRGALGLMQVRPRTGRDVAQRNEIPLRADTALLEPELNLLIGATYLAELKQRFGTWDLALTAYNRGPTYARRLARRSPDRRPTSRYAGRILKRYESLLQSPG